jgi:hypothetical protein
MAAGHTGDESGVAERGVDARDHVDAGRGHEQARRAEGRALARAQGRALSGERVAARIRGEATSGIYCTSSAMGVRLNPTCGAAPHPTTRQRGK